MMSLIYYNGPVHFDSSICQAVVCRQCYGIVTPDSFQVISV